MMTSYSTSLSPNIRRKSSLDKGRYIFVFSEIKERKQKTDLNNTIVINETTDFDNVDHCTLLTY